MAEITKHLGVAISDADDGRITKRQLLEIFQEAVDNGDILEEENTFYVVSAIFPLLDKGILKRSRYVDEFERKMNAQAHEMASQIKQSQSRNDDTSTAETNRRITKEELLTLMSGALVDVENAIHNHPAATIALYERGKQAFLEGQAKVEETEWSRMTGLTLPQLAIMHQYLFSNAFMSAWHSMHGDKKRRDQITQSACLLVSGLGFTPEDIMHRYMEYERAWCSSMQASGIGREGRFGCLGMIIILTIVMFGWLIWL